MELVFLGRLLAQSAPFRVELILRALLPAVSAAGRNREPRRQFEPQRLAEFARLKPKRQQPVGEASLRGFGAEGELAGENEIGHVARGQAQAAAAIGIADENTVVK